MPFQREAELVLARWREVERALEHAVDEVLAEDLTAEAARLRDEYQALVSAARKAHRPEPPPFPEDA